MQAFSDSKLAILVLLLPALSFAQSKDDIFDGLVDRELANYSAVENFLLEEETMGMTTVQFYERTSSFEHNGETHYIMRNVPINEMQERQSQQNALSNASPEELRMAADQIQAAGDMMGSEFDRQIAESGMGGTVIGTMISNPPADQPWLSPNPRDSTFMFATMLRGAADGKEMQAAEDPEADARKALADLDDLRQQIELTGFDTMPDGTRVAVLASNIQAPAQIGEGDESFEPRRIDLWVDAELFVPRKMIMQGVMRAEGELRDITIQREEFDYRTFPGCGDIYKPTRSVMRIAGMMTPEQEAEMQEAMGQMAEFEQQMAQMPESQRAMIMRQMGPQMEMMKNMASGDGIQVESKISNLKCNTTIPDALQIALTTFGGGIIGTAAGSHGGELKTEDNVVQIVQGHLLTLGFDPGNTDGQLTKKTVVAISQYQATNGLEVTGQATPQLAGILSAAVDAMN